jgi:hypothetical protein
MSQNVLDDCVPWLSWRLQIKESFGIDDPNPTYQLGSTKDVWDTYHKNLYLLRHYQNKKISEVRE